MNKRIIQSTLCGPIIILWDIVGQAPRIKRVLLSKPSTSALDRVAERYPDIQESSCPQIDHVVSGILKLLEGKPIEFPLKFVDLDICGKFRQKVLRAEHAIPRGSVSTYKRIAVYLGVPGGARAVGNALATNPFPLIVPCHRAIRSDLTLGGYQGGLKMKQALLEHEGITFDSVGRVQCKHFHYEKQD